ncbi:hypothetical protein CDEST_15181 [Colletotrichum destructivum]|uniref:Uncharacterized protein n=1 Tax=Colletotrichum destructivum TaxID=34406 RepID=A0AAX4J493_9PEZI|nr:hypothetical protein CDEST_15181 [Colletotrichum destructivum]
MVSFNSLITFLTLAAASPLSVSAASVPRQYAENGEIVREGGSWLPNPETSPLNTRQTPWDDYHRMTEFLTEKSVCHYLPVPNSRDTNWPCRQCCEKLTGNYGSSPEAQCVCTTISVDLEAKIIEGLETSGAVIYSVWLFSIRQVLEKVSYAIPGGGPVLRVVKAIAKSIRKLMGSGKGKEAWASMVKDTCGSKGYNVNMGIERAYDIFKSAPSE